MSRKRKSRTEIKARKKAQKQTRTRLIIGGAFLAVVLVVGSLITVQQLQARSLRDLSVIGSGVPVVVHVHDRTCPVCTSLLGSVQEVRKDFDDDELFVRVAELHTEVGAAFARRHNAGRVTLLFFDAQGNLVDRQSGDQHPDTLRARFSRHANE